MADEEENLVYWWIPLGLDFVLYGTTCFMIFKRKNYNVISVRTPTLLIFSILGNFFVSSLIILFKIFGQKFYVYFYYCFQVMMIVSIFLRYERIIMCCGIDKNDTNDMREFYRKRYMFTEKFYFRVLVIFLIGFLIISSITAIVEFKFFKVFFFTEISKANMYIWLAWNFAEQLILFTYMYRLYNSIDPKLYVKLELFLITILFFFYSNILFIFSYYSVNTTIIIITSLIVLYCCLIIQGVLPVIFSFKSPTLVSYHFPLKLVDNLYLFLTNETCYKYFNYYLVNSPPNDNFYLRLYTSIMKFKLDFMLEEQIEAGLEEAQNIYNTYIENPEYATKFESDVLLKVKNDCSLLDGGKYNESMFDKAFSFAFEKLNIIFKEFKFSREFSILQAKIGIESYVRCKMYNTGLINKN